MLFNTFALASFALASAVRAQTAASAYVEPDVPTGKPIAGDYTGALRPQIHYSPPKDFMNDPNGLFLDANGTYHLYYQYNPTDIVAGNQHWGHATSTDLYHWVNQQIAIFPGAKGEGIFSGSAVIDVNNTSGFFPGQNNGVVAIYTLNTAAEETQEIAYSSDGGYTFTKYANNPVISTNSTQFRDPKVIWYAPTQKWVMVVSYAQEFVIGIYTSPNLKEWTHASNFSHHGLLGLQYECPNLVSVPMLKNASIASPLDPSNYASVDQMYVLAISINPGAPLGGSITQYFPGTFNGTHFTTADDATRLTDFAKDNYAGQFFYNIPADKPQLSIAWASNWEYSQLVPTGPLENFRSFMTLPRLNVLANTTRGPYTLMQLPYDLSPLQMPVANTTKLANSSLLYDYSQTVPSGALSFNMTITNIPLANTTGTANFTFMSSVTGESIRGGFFLGGDTPFFLNRGYVNGFDRTNPFFTDKFSVNNLINPDTQTWRITVVIDRSILEVFLDNGLRCGTMTFFPEGELDTLIVASSEVNPGVNVAVDVYGLKSAWGSYEGVNGTVAGNSTMGMMRRDQIGRLVY